MAVDFWVGIVIVDANTKQVSLTNRDAPRGKVRLLWNVISQLMASLSSFFAFAGRANQFIARLTNPLFDVIDAINTHHWLLALITDVWADVSTNYSAIKNPSTTGM